MHALVRLFAVLCLLFCLMTLAQAQLARHDQLWSLGVQAMQVGDWSAAVKAWESVVALPTWPFAKPVEEAQVQLATAYRQCRQYDKATQLLLQAVGKHPRDIWTVRILVQLTAVGLAQGQHNATDRILTFLLDDVTCPPTQVESYLTGLMKETGLVDPPVAALGRYIDTHPGHPSADALRVIYVRLLVAAGDRARALAVTQALLENAAGTANDLATASLLAEEYLRQGAPDKAWAVLQQRARYGAPDTRVIALTVAAFRQAGDQEHTAEVATRLIAATPLPSQPVEALCWLAHTALAAGDLPTAQRWVDLLTKYAPEYPMVTRVRRALREAKGAAPTTPSGSIPATPK